MEYPQLRKLGCFPKNYVEFIDAAPSVHAPATSKSTLSKALYDYEARGEGELTIKVGDIIKILDSNSSEEWYEGNDNLHLPTINKHLKR
jgi:hypothetical protein